ncbi:hypothetical protein BCR42DRAFT_409945 [Absidia repens]|uniref:Something about silencing protein 4 domain-containing protein n=1 Tax=Absidia repens TaxID=90262 RepID=A0A1X2INB6_9FUNG|nr:hypothetical protein BCR42DRAFT_409945 [Absidia repens]
MVEERSKRALPARHSFLTEAVSSVLDSQSKVQLPQVDSRTVLKLDQDTSYCTIHGESTPPLQTSSDTQPIFRILPQRRPTKTKNSIPLSDDYYIARHRKHEMEEKKQKKSRKRTQQQLVERLKTLDKSTLASIVSSLRSVNNSNPQLPSSSSTYISMTTNELERLHQTLLQDAREQMYRYEQLGLGRKRGQGFAASTTQSRISSTKMETDYHPSPATVTSKTKNHRASEENVALESSKSTPPQPKSPPPSPPSPPSPPTSTSSCSASPYTKKAIPSAPSNSSPLPSSSSSSSSSVTTTTTTTTTSTKPSSRLESHESNTRESILTNCHCLWGKIPAMDEIEFKLPDDVFGDLMLKRTTDSSRRRRLA